ncbi:hypothetical protein RR46_08480 [Papilio xuthus]|uniref:Uncharacterized protein n=1 Tax=Papilio xuthus TaxID=66420 RepID=A0A194Q7E2_PAPXU|nr:hypothetical protein RR46_08480 [Papilio xuthus]
MVKQKYSSIERDKRRNVIRPRLRPCYPHPPASLVFIGHSQEGAAARAATTKVGWVSIVRDFDAKFSTKLVYDAMYEDAARARESRPASLYNQLKAAGDASANFSASRK